MGATLLSLIEPLPRPNRALAAGVGAVLFGAFVGMVLAADVPLGVALVLGACYAPLVFLNLPLAVVLWIPLVFVEGVPAFNLGAKAAGLLLAIGWAGMLYTGSGVSTGVLRRHRRLVEALVCLLVWATLSLAWASDLDRAMGSVWQWWAVAIVFLIVATCIRSDATLRLAVGAFVAGAVLTILAGLALGNVGAGEATTRFTGGAGDPNFLASGLVPAIVLAGGLAGASKAAGLRWIMLAVIAFLALGVVMSESRGAAVASVVTVAAALIFFKHRRMYVVALAMVAVGFAVLAFTIVPGSWERVSNVGESGARGDIWTVAWRVGEDHALVGVGTKNFQTVAADYVQEPGTLTHVGLIAEETKAVHNLYLELFAEIGIVGLLLFLIVAGGCLRAAWLAARRFEALGRRDLETVARSILVANIAMLATAIFLSSQVDKRLWILLALGPAALEVARRISPRVAG
ncbi:hypothetical protein BH20ACT13_BH20ACT13_24580 [soil metagenome]